MHGETQLHRGRGETWKENAAVGCRRGLDGGHVEEKRVWWFPHTWWPRVEEYAGRAVSIESTTTKCRACGISLS